MPKKKKSDKTEELVEELLAETKTKEDEHFESAPSVAGKIIGRKRRAQKILEDIE